MTLKFLPSFPQILKQEAEKVLTTELEIGKQFKSSDSFSFLLFNNSEKYVGKIYRFDSWPPPGKLELVDELLNEQNIPHEEIIYITHNHPTFTYGWQLSRYIPGELVTNQEKHFIELGSLLKQIHAIHFDNFGSIESSKNRFKTFQEFAKDELDSQDFSTLPSEYSWVQNIIDKAKNEVLAKLDTFQWNKSSLVHDDANHTNVIWQNGSPILIDWVDALAAPQLRDFATMTFREDTPNLSALEKGYEQSIDKQELRLHQIMRFIRLGYFFYFEDQDIPEFEKVMPRLEQLLSRDEPYGV